MSNASLTPTGGWYADPMDAAQLRWWDGVNWTPQTTPATAASGEHASDIGMTFEDAPTTGPVAPVTPISPAAGDAAAAAPVAPAPAAEPADGPGIYIPRNSVFKMAEAVDGQAYSPEWSGLSDISDEVALSGVPVQLALTATPSEGPPIPVSADAFPILGVAPVVSTPEPTAPAWRVEEPLAAPIDQLFPISAPAVVEAPAVVAPVAPTPIVPTPIAQTTPAAAFPVADVFPIATVFPTEAPVAAPAAPVAPVAVAAPVAPLTTTPVTPAPLPAAAFSIAVGHAPEPVAGPTLSPDVFPTAAPAGALAAALPPTGALFPGLVPNSPEPVAEAPVSAPTSVPVLAAVPDLVEVAEPVAAEPAVAEPVAVLPVVAEPVAAEPVAAEPVIAGPVIAEPVAAEPVAAEPVAAEPILAEPVAAEPVLAQPVLSEPVAAEPVATAAIAAAEPVLELVPEPVAAPALPPAPAAPVSELYAGPTVSAVPVPAPFDAPIPDLAPTVPEGGAPFVEGPAYEPLVARAIPEPLQFGAPVDTVVATPAAVAATPTSAPDAPTAGPSAGATTAAPETAWPTEGTYQPHPGNYVPFDPNAVRVEEAVPAIPFSSRDPYNAASTSRPALRSYGLAPVGPSGSTYTPALVIILITPLLIAAGYALLFQLNAINVGLAPNLALAGLLVALAFVGIGAAQFDRNTLAKRGYFDLASPFWILLSPLVYLGVRASRVRSQGSGGVRAVLLWFAAWAGAAAILAFSTFAALTSVTPDRIAMTEQSVAQQFVVQKVVPQVDCPKIPSFASGTVFNCTATAGSTVQLVQVTITDWMGSESYKLISTMTAPAAATATAP